MTQRAGTGPGHGPAPGRATAETDQRHMAAALTLGARGLGRVWPNPAVGCIIVDAQGRVAGRGWTAPGGRPHAEPQALAQAGTAARGGTAYVTLEPCAHTGQTPPCARTLIEAGIARVVTALEDPDPRVAGEGHAMLRAAGVDVVTGVLEDRVRAMQLGFLSRITRGRPMLTLKLATSLDGRIATASGESQWITGPEARRRVHAMRASHDAVMVGAGTARADDPGLTVRGLGISWQPVRVVVSRRLDLPLEGQLARTARDVPVWLCHGPDADRDLIAAWQGLGARLLACPVGPDRQIDPAGLLETLGAAGLTRVFCEGGGALAASLLLADVVDRLAMFGAGVALGAEGWPALGAMGLGALSEAPRLRLSRVEQLGGDVLSLWEKDLRDEV
ncbi:bifunctional diaminohydroxyphosphoribosylaminopyrimidine deaminase/5-amino-6-(5-phosphoribosylamino)uracil reductase RibD [Pacificitalea manganoxidans]|uniref:bifunctional diaminohydroxyphosphoribosylaminopyrimidine deaminase/5-amino-6-(5-phosphoribosylamino)uracil reductase RibD n=1 Tax=Pacificitalea manganoxidans TaxID=1411902 RepID=UPI0022B7C309|nr:bifunctional diaminohydroxyphosphoribosylaminopyrimidine deaminase/5-amino-6-(5-phosphoribosylamino)uracil reductase RibD [Pacificitalea manganoxidans]MDR6309336.1 diaminohydroxyphosphoribosylaminopyrimidine deaminase/5-amino-6-(5-phosphoribosylamino)uracil reductase [Pacificitalea manganoxidans]